MPRNLVYSFLHEVHCFTGNRLTCVWPMNQAMRQMGSEMRGDGVKYCMSGDTSTTPCEGWFFYNSCGYRSRGTPKTTFSSPFYTYYESSWGLRWNSPSIQCRERAGMNWGALLWRCVLQRSEVSPDETLGRWINVVSWAPAPWLTEMQSTGGSIQAILFNWQRLTIIRSHSRGLCVQAVVNTSHELMFAVNSLDVLLNARPQKIYMACSRKQTGGFVNKVMR